MRGLPPEEKALMQRIANLMDAALNNRQASNPFEPSRAKGNRQIFPPTGLIIKTGLKSVKIIWNATPSNELLRYEVDFTNITTGETVIKTTFTSEIIYKAPAGSYVAIVKSVGRDGSSSTVKKVEFSVGEDVMLIEGAKNGPLELGTLVQDNIKLFEGYSIYAWGSTVLDKYIAGSSNNQIVFRLWRAETADASFSEAVLQETITLYPATESGSSLDDTARAGAITRPSGTRTGSFETSQAIMFSPMSVDSSDDEKTVTFFLQAINRETEQDEVGLSLVLWAGADGVGTNTPGDPFTPDPAFVFPNLNSFRSQKVGWNGGVPTDIRNMWATIPDGFSLIGNQWTIAMWIRFDDLNSGRMSTVASSGNPNGGDQIILSRGAMRNDRNFSFNEWLITASATENTPSPGDKTHLLKIRVGNLDGDQTRTITYKADVFGDDDDSSAGLWTWGDSENQNPTTGSGWYLLVICFEGGSEVTDISKIRTYLNSGGDEITGPPIMELLEPSGVNPFLQSITQDDSGKLGYNLGNKSTDVISGNYIEGVYTGNQRYPETSNILYHQLGIWNVALDSTQAGTGWNIGPINRLFNGGDGTAVNWKENTTDFDAGGPLDTQNYNQEENLVHLIQFGAVEQPMSTGFPGRDTGNPVFGGDLNFTGKSENFVDPLTFPDSSTKASTGNHWTDDTSIADVLSPEGNNGTTQFDKSYPGA
jgi:hypothetical protein